MSDPIWPHSVVVAWLSGGTTRMEFTRSLAAATYYSAAVGIPLVGALPQKSGPRIAAGRNHVCEAFLNLRVPKDGQPHAAEWLLMIDDDMTFKADVIEQFLNVAHPDAAPIVGGHCFGAGRDGYFPTLYKINAHTSTIHRMLGYPRDTMVSVDATGAACLFIHRTVLEKLAGEYPEPWRWFQETSIENKSVGEDVTFCLRARAAGYPVWVHTGINFGHMKDVEVDVDFYDMWNSRNRYVITGTGRSGTGYMAALFSSLGVPCEHEGVYKPDGYRWDWQRGDASWMAAPHLDQFDGQIIHITRHPLDTINSFVGIGFFDDDPADGHRPYIDYARKHCPEAFEPDTPTERAMRFWVEWNRMIEPYATVRFQLEQLNGDDLKPVIHQAGGWHAEFEIDQKIKLVPGNINSRRRAELTWNDLPEGETRTQLEAMTVEYGYQIEVTV